MSSSVKKTQETGDNNGMAHPYTYCYMVGFTCFAAASRKLSRRSGSGWSGSTLMLYYNNSLYPKEIMLPLQCSTRSATVLSASYLFCRAQTPKEHGEGQA